MKDKLTHIAVYQEELNDFEKLVNELGPQVNISLDSGNWDEPLPYNPDFPNRSMAVRESIRAIALDSMGYDRRARFFSKDILMFPTSDGDKIHIRLGILGIDEYQKVKEIMGKPNYRAYNWEDFYVWNFGNFQELETSFSGGLFANAAEGMLLFSDEVEKLKAGENITTFHMSGMSSGFLNEEKEIFSVMNENFYRAIARIVD